METYKLFFILVFWLLVVWMYIQQMYTANENGVRFPKVFLEGFFPCGILCWSGVFAALMWFES